MNKLQVKKSFLLKLTCISVLFFLTGCDNNSQNTNISEQPVPSIDETITPVNNQSTQPEPELENKSYLFNVTGHSIEELEALLIRAEEVSQAHPAEFEDLEIVMVIHGPDIDWFTNQNYEHNRQLIDLAARLDAYDIIDMKVCETIMNKRGVDRKDIPPFIESVPYGPAEIKQRLDEGYINL